jgi:hypothetical protein
MTGPEPFAETLPVGALKLHLGLWKSVHDRERNLNA